MAKLLVISIIFFFFLFSALTYSATVYTVGDNGGWDVSTDLDSWSRGKTFAVGDTLMFQYSQYHSVKEVSKENYDVCNTTNVIESSSNGNTTFALTRPGERYFVCGNRLHCLGGMKVEVNVVANETAASPVGGAPEAEPGVVLPPGSSKSNNPVNSAIGQSINMVPVFFGLLPMILFENFVLSSW